MTRLRPAGVRPLEIWDAPVPAGRTLFGAQGDPDFPAVLARVAAGVADAAAADTGPAPAQVFLTGGGARRPGVARALAAAGFGVIAADDPVFAAARAGLRLAAGARRAMCADVGQTAVKLARGGRCWRVERDMSRAPFRDGVPLPLRASARASTLAFLVEALTAADPGAPLDDPPAAVDAVVLALPCEIEDDGTVSGCSYPWDTPDRALLGQIARMLARMLARMRARMLARARASERARAPAGADAGAPTGADTPPRVYALNDAELAAVAAAADPRLGPGRTLVLTLGFGIGAAILDPAARARRGAP